MAAGKSLCNALWGCKLLRCITDGVASAACANAKEASNGSSFGAFSGNKSIYKGSGKFEPKLY